MTQARLLPHRRFPSYAYQPGRMPHPVRDAGGHSYRQKAAPVVEPMLGSDEFLWGLDLFNNGFYWEAHEAWEPLWRATGQDDPRRLLLKGLILLAAAGVKVHERKPRATARHASRAASLFRAIGAQAPSLACAIGISLIELADCVQEVAERSDAQGRSTFGLPGPVFGFVLGPRLENTRAGSPAGGG